MSGVCAVDINNCEQLKGTMNPFILVIRRGHFMMRTIVACADKLELSSAALSGIGAVEDPEIAYYNLEAGRYDPKKFTGIYELASFIGNVTFNEGKRFCHAHATLAKGNCENDYKLIGGHLIETKIGVIGEILVTPLAGQLSRLHDEETNLNLIQTI